MPDADPLINLETFASLAKKEMPLIATLGIRAEEITRRGVTIRAECQDAFLRPGGTIAGPVIMGLADVSFYVVILANLGLVKMAVTTSLNINFLHKPPPGDLIAKAKLLKLGRRLAVCDCDIFSETRGFDAPVAHATGTYSLPQQ